MAGFSVYYAQRQINNDLVNGATKYLALFTADPTDANLTANELGSGWYTRQAVSGWAAPAGSGTSTHNTNTVTYNAVTGNAVTVTHWGLYDASPVGTGNLWISGPLATAKVLNVDDVFVINAGDLVLDYQ